MAKIGLLAGYGELPVLFSRIAREKGDTVIAFGLKGATQKELAGHVDKIHWLEWGDLKKGLLLLVTERIKKVVMLGKIKKEIVLKGDGDLDEEAKELFKKIKDKKDYAILGAVAGMFKKIGIEVMDPAAYLKDLIPSKGTITKREPTKEEWQDIRYGFEVAKELSRFDIGQTVVIKDRTVIAVEAADGTDETISRSGSLTGGGFAVVKVARPDQDMRFDIPIVGPDTVRAVIKGNGKVLALEEKRMFLLGREEVIKLADENDISITVV